MRSLSISKFLLNKILLKGPFVLLIIALTSITAFSSDNAKKVQWEPYSIALKNAAVDKKMVFTYLSASWCTSCKGMEKNTFTDPFIVNILNTRFHPVKLDVNSEEAIVCDEKEKTVERCFFDVWKLNGVPSFVLIAPKGLTILTLTQSLEANEMRLLLQHFLKKEKEWVLE